MIHLEHFKHVEVSIHGQVRRNKLYFCTCDKCGADKGYKPKSYKTPSCNKCCRKGTILSEEVKNKMSQAATVRYNDPNWVPKDRSLRGHSRNKTRKYTSKTTPVQRKMRKTMKALLWQKLKNRSMNKNGSTFDLLGYNADDLIQHLESQFEPGMSWNNYGIGGWEIDHKIPDSWFTYSSTADLGFKDSWKLSNLQPMWAKENISKGNKVSASEIVCVLKELESVN